MIGKRIGIVFLVVLLILVLIGFVASIFIYKGVFGERMDGKLPPYSVKAEELNNLNREKAQFKSNYGQLLTGYFYTPKDTRDYKGIIILSNGMGGGHINYLGEINYFVSNNYVVFGYDGTGIAESQGKNPIGMGQAIIDLDNAIKYVKSRNEYNNLKLTLLGHSWGGYAVTSVLNINDKADNVIALSGFNKSQDMIIEYGKGEVGNSIYVLSPFLYIYEKIKFGKIIDYTGIKGINNSTANILLIHSKDDDVISMENSLYSIKDKVENRDRLETILLEDSGHNAMMMTKNARNYKKEIVDGLRSLSSKYGGRDNIPKDVLDEYYSKVNKTKINELDEKLLNSMIQFMNK